MRRQTMRKQTYALIIGVAIATLAAATAVGGISGAQSDPRPGPSDEAGLDRASAALLASDARDPRGGPAWAVKEYRTTDGRVCAKPGRRVGSHVGSLQRDGTLAGSDIREGGDCVDVDQLSDAEPISWHISTEVHDPRTGAKAPVTFIWGLARPDVKQVTIAANGGERTSAFGSNRGFITVFDGAAMGDSVKFTLHMADGTSRTYTTPELGPSQRETLRRQLAGIEP